MADFHQTGVITTLHRLGLEDLDRLVLGRVAVGAFVGGVEAALQLDLGGLVPGAGWARDRELVVLAEVSQVGGPFEEPAVGADALVG